MLKGIDDVVWHRLTHAYGPALDVPTTLKTKPSGESPWSVRTLARHLGISRTMVHRVWQRFDIQPHHVEKLKLSNDPQFEEKVQRYRGLVVVVAESPGPSSGLVCVDEKSHWLPRSHRNYDVPAAETVRATGTPLNVDVA